MITLVVIRIIVGVVLVIRIIVGIVLVVRIIRWWIILVVIRIIVGTIGSGTRIGFVHHQDINSTAQDLIGLRVNYCQINKIFPITDIRYHRYIYRKHFNYKITIINIAVKIKRIKKFGFIINGSNRIHYIFAHHKGKKINLNKIVIEIISRF